MQPMSIRKMPMSMVVEPMGCHFDDDDGGGGGGDGDDRRYSFNHHHRHTRG